MSTKRIAIASFAALVLTLIIAFELRTMAELKRPPATLDVTALDDAVAPPVQVLDRNGERLNVTFTSAWNFHDVAPLHDIPPFLRTAFVVAEDKRFFEHRGIDWSARLSALVTNVRSGSAVRGASTITEQVVRMLHPRPRTVWSKWLEGFEARRFEQRFNKHEILEFYLNQVPYASNRRGVRQAAAHYFARDLGTLSQKEVLALVVLVRAPSRFDLLRDAAASEAAIGRLADALVERELISLAERAELVAQPFVLDEPRLAVSAPHFVEHVRERLDAAGSFGAARVATTLDSRLQAKVQALLDERLLQLQSRRVANGAVLAVDHRSGEVLAYAVAGGGGAGGPVSHIDAIATPRQPGSALKPFLYALALDRGWSAAQVIDDAPLSESIATGLHSYQNYSRRFYGPVTLRDALGNSLNIPALKTLQYVGSEAYLERLRALGFQMLAEHPDFYGDGIALGSGAVTLFELVQAYAALANGGVFRPLSPLLHDAVPRSEERVFSAEAASLVADILSDPDARALEFGRDSVLALPVQTAVKTGTSSDFHDAWAVGFNHRYTVGVWFGNLDQTPTDGVTGSIGPALLLRSVLAELTRDRETRPLYLNPNLTRRSVCVPLPPTNGSEECIEREEWFAPGSEPADSERTARSAKDAEPPRLRRPTDGLQLAYDPRLPAEAQAFEFSIDGVGRDDRVVWVIDGQEYAADAPQYQWSLARGEHRVRASVWRGAELVAELPEVAFNVK